LILQQKLCQKNNSIMNKDKNQKRKTVKKIKVKTKDSSRKKDSVVSQNKYDELQKKYNEAYDSMLRATAEMENIKKRTQKEIENIYKFSNESIIQELIPIYESLDLSVNFKKESISSEKLEEGNKILLSMLSKLFEKNNVKEINPLNDEFNPEYHQAISTKEDKSLKNNLIIEVVQKGYLLNERVIKPALVIVVKNL
tara:strand:- start:23 stop:613 length:591 start_codon:yes stop_codon:yes gene_type:complete